MLEYHKSYSDMNTASVYATIAVQHSDGANTKIQYCGDLQSDKIILILPALGMSSKHYLHFGTFLSEKLSAVCVCADLRGLGLSSIRVSKGIDFGYEDIVNDIKDIMTVIWGNFSGKKTFIIGHSIGGQLAALYLAREKPPIDGLLTIAACSVYYKGWGDGMQGYILLFQTQFIGVLSRILGYFPGKKVGFGATEAKTLMTDWSRLARTGKFLPANATCDYEKLLPEIKLPIRSFAIEKDNFAPVAAIHYLGKKFDATKTGWKCVVIPRQQGEIKLNHFNWLKYPEYLLNDLSNFIN
ncbi:MAG: alpha/beta fold hydrolase [Chitinophagales bacterium]|nr:alpha/beta fold hydrolase [Chitinophagales bacterium]